MNLDDLLAVEDVAPPCITCTADVEVSSPHTCDEPTAPTLVSVLESDRCALLHGDSALIGTVLAPNSIDALVCDPPAGIAFMGKSWDKDKGGRDQWIAWLRDLLIPSFNALKPGAHGLVWALPRTSHWTATALEDAGFEIRDVIMHLFGTGFPKSLTSKSAAIPEGTGSALKPAAEHWILVRKPLEGTYAENFAKYGTGVLNIDACRIGTAGGGQSCPGGDRCTHYNRDENGENETSQTGATKHNPPSGDAIGRWPAHVALSHSEHCILAGEPDEVRVPECADDCPILLMDAQSGITKSSKGKPRGSKTPGDGWGMTRTGAEYTDSGGASRFFYQSKGSRKEKDEGLDHLPVKNGGEATGRAEGSKGTQNPRAGAGRTGGARNHHPTVKGVDLMRWLVRLVTPPGGTVLDVFAGSGTTGVAALAEGRSFIGVELTSEYLPITIGRLQHALSKLSSDNGNEGN